MAAPPDRDVAKITVTGLEIFNVKVNRRGNWMLTRISTSAGITGIGDASHGGADDERVRYLKQFFELIKGRSIYDIERLRAAAPPRSASPPVSPAWPSAPSRPDSTRSSSPRSTT
jgi:galactonate dehydratase